MTESVIQRSIVLGACGDEGTEVCHVHVGSGTRAPNRHTKIYKLA